MDGLILTLNVEEINGILYALGELPAKTNSMALIEKIKAQAEPQLPPPQDEPKQE